LTSASERRARWIFAAYVFLPAALALLLPVFFFQIPMVAWLWDGSTYVASQHVWTAVGAGALWLGLAAGIVVGPGRSRAPARPWAPPTTWLGFVALSFLGVPLILVNAWCGLPSSVTAVMYWLSFVPVFAFLSGMALMVVPAPRGARLFLWVLMGVDLVMVVLVPISLSKVTPAVLAVIAILYGLHAGSPRRTWLATMALLLPLLAVSIPAKEFLREAIYEGDVFRKPSAGCAFPYRFQLTSLSVTRDAYLGRAKRLALRTEGFRPYVARISEREPLAGYAMARALIRMNRLSDFSYVVSTTPSDVAFTGMTTYTPLLSKPIPRLLWRDKPVDETGQLYGHRYGFLAPGDTTHSANLTIVAEAWMGGGWPYIIWTALAYGLVLRAIWMFLVGDSRAVGNVAIGAMVVAAAAHYEANLSAVVGGIIQVVVISMAVEATIRLVGGRLTARSALLRRSGSSYS